MFYAKTLSCGRVHLKYPVNTNKETSKVDYNPRSIRCGGDHLWFSINKKNESLLGTIHWLYSLCSFFLFSNIMQIVHVLCKTKVLRRWPSWIANTHAQKTGILKRAIQGTFQPSLLSNGSVVSEKDNFIIFFHIVFYVKTFFCGVVAILVFQLYRTFLQYHNALCPAISQKIILSYFSQSMAQAITLNFSITNNNLNFEKYHAIHIPTKFGSNWPRDFGENWNVKTLQIWRRQWTQRDDYSSHDRLCEL